MITVRHLSQTYGKKEVLHNISFSVPDGQVTGFVGPNGSGKSTTMRCMLGLEKPTQGLVHYTMNNTVVDYIHNPHKTRIVNALLDASWVDGQRNAYDHLRVLAAAQGVAKKRIDYVLDSVGLSDAAHKKISTFSLGMRQRLGIAAVLLNDPQHLIFDEPVNGLDPEGVRWVREFSQEQARAGKAVLISSHLLAEMQLTADRLVLIGRGNIIGEYSMQEFLSGSSIIVRVDQPHILHMALSGAGIDNTVDSQGSIRVAISEETDQEFTKKIIQDEITKNALLIEEFRVETRDLENVFLEKTAQEMEYVSKEYV